MGRVHTGVQGTPGSWNIPGAAEQAMDMQLCEDMGRGAPLGEGVRDGHWAEPLDLQPKELRKGRYLQRMKEQKEDQRPRAGLTHLASGSRGRMRGRVREATTLALDGDVLPGTAHGCL